MMPTRKITAAVRVLMRRQRQGWAGDSWEEASVSSVSMDRLCRKKLA